MQKEEKKESKGEKKAETKKNEGETKGDGPITVVLKLDLHCEGCALKIKRSVKNFEGTICINSEKA